MSIYLTRRAALLGGMILLRSLGSSARGEADSARSDGTNGRITDLEKRSGGRLGVAVLDTASRARLHYRAEERFAMCSTFKFVVAAAILQRVERGQERLDRWIPYGPQDLLEYAPVTRQHAQQHGMRLSDLCAAAVEWSDNTAANLMLRTIGGPAGFTQYCRSLGDRVTRLDRIEPMLHQVGPGDSRDTTTPAAMLALLNTLLLGKALSASSRAQLESWLVNAKVGKERISAGLPSDWRIGDKTGTGRDEANDVVIAWPTGKTPILISAFYQRSSGSQDERDAVLRELGHIVATAL
ncbi:MAG TPA: class A beta-lactamase [Steroidobacteraceae bacterium]|jgi:beta-lactamase class A